VTASTQAGQSAWEQYRAGERNAEAIARAYQANQSLQDWRAGERTANAGEKSPMPASTPTSDTKKPKSFWQRAGEWIEDKVNRFVIHPPSWLSVSYSLGPFSLGNYTATHWVSYQPLARNLWETVGYQHVQVELQTKNTLTTNPKGAVDIDFSDGTITFNGKNTSVFIQPGALSFGWGSSIYQGTTQDGTIYHAINKNVVDIDVFGKNMLSFKVSHMTGTEASRIAQVDGTDVKKTLETEVDVAINVHRWPRVIVGAAAVYFAFEAGVTVVAPRVLPWVAEQITAVAPLLGIP
jgi:hypothetical protein